MRGRQELKKEEMWKKRTTLKGKEETLRGGKTGHSRNDGKMEEKTFSSNHSGDEGRGKTRRGRILVK